MPSNFYFSVTPAIGVVSLNEGGTTYDTKNGFAIRLAVGKEWWVSDNWGLGLNLQYAHASNESKTGVKMSTNWAGLAFSATYN
jgi:hypothetical protein